MSYERSFGSLSLEAIVLRRILTAYGLVMRLIRGLLGRFLVDIDVVFAPLNGTLKVVIR
jgi:hypothetical protein